MLAWMFIALAVGPAPGEELHVVCVHEPRLRVNGKQLDQDVFVLVKRPGKDVTLYLSAYNPATWRVLVDPQTKLKKVILGGYHQQTANVPKGVEVVEMFYESKKRPPREYLYAYYNIDSGRFRSSAQAIRKFTGQELASYQGTYNYDANKPFLVNRPQFDERLHSDYPRLTPPEDLPKVSFRATYLTQLDRFGFAASVGDYTQSGPDKHSLKPLPKNIVSVTYDPTGKKHYGLTHHEIHEINLENGTGEKMNPGNDVPRVSWPCGITFDTKRDRLVVATLGGAGHFYTYSPKTGAWASPATLNNIDLAALAYHPKDDSLYGLAAERGNDGEGGLPVLHQFNAQGALIKTTPLERPMFPGLVGRGPTDSRVQLASVADHLAVIVAGVGGRDAGGNRGQGESFLYFIDPKTGKVKLGWKE